MRSACEQHIELLAPAGDWDCARAAVENGADAIYFGLERFNARMRAKNFTIADLPELISYLHLRGVHGYVTFNTLIFETELDQAQETIKAIAAAGVDAVIVQDIGLCRLIRQIAPDLPIHASTQMTITSAAGVQFARSIGCNLAVLARECSLNEVEQISKSAADCLPLEIFVHGALCVAYSGQCLTSEALGGRSANRGECAQACRMPYDLIVDGKPFPLDQRKYLLSPQDLSGIDIVPQIVKSGVCSLKIEGRLKSPLYVASVTRVYRQALDRAMDGVLSSKSSSADDRYELEMAFSRGLFSGWLEGINNQLLVHARYPKKRGVYLGQVTAVNRDSVAAELQGPLDPGDGVVFDCGKPETAEEGGRVFEIERSRHGAILRFGNGAVDFNKIRPGAKIFKTSDPRLEKELRATFENQTVRRKQPLQINVSGRSGEPLLVAVTDEQGRRVELRSAQALQAAASRPLDRETIAAKIGALGETPFEAGQLQIDLPEPVFLPLAELKRMRRGLIDSLCRLRTEPLNYRIEVNYGAAAPQSLAAPQQAPAQPRLSVLLRSQQQLNAALELCPARVYLDFENVKHYKNAVDLCREHSPQVEVFVAPPRIYKCGEDWILRHVAAAQSDGILARNFDHLRYFSGARFVADFSFNIANHLSAEILKADPRIETLTPSYDLNVEQLLALFRSAPADWFEVTIHQRMPMFHMEHCVFCAFLSSGKDYRDCGRPCDSHKVELRDRTGSDLFLKADSGCRNTVFNSKAQTGAEFIGHFLKAGCSRFRIDFVDEQQAAAADLIKRYRALIRGEVSGSSLWRDLRLLNQLGVTRGQLVATALPGAQQS